MQRNGRVERLGEDANPSSLGPGLSFPGKTNSLVPQDAKGRGLALMGLHPIGLARDLRAPARQERSEVPPNSAAGPICPLQGRCCMA